MSIIPTMPHELMAAMLAVLLASLLGSGHCAGMCGPIMLFAVGGFEQTRSSRIWLHTTYHLGRGISYTLAGGLAGSIGAALELGGGFVGVQRGAAVVFGLLMVFAGLGLVGAHMGVRLRGIRVPALYQRTIERAHRVALSLPRSWRAGAVGVCTPLLPCGWLYLFILAAAGTGHPAWGAGIMLAFWAGTLPILASLGLGLELIGVPLRRHLPLVSGLAVIAVGGMAVLGRITMPSFSSLELRVIMTSTTRQGFAVPDQIPPCCTHEITQEGRP